MLSQVDESAIAGHCSVVTSSKPPVPASNTARLRSRRLADAYRVAADAPATVRAYAADWTQFSAWCLARSIQAIPAEPALVGEYLAELGEGYARSTLRRKVAAIARANRMAGAPLDTRHTAIRDVLRGIGRTHGLPARRAQALTTGDVQQLVETCGDDLVGVRDRAMLLVMFAGALRRSELCAIEVEHVRWKRRGFELLIPRSKTDPEAEGDRIVLAAGEHAATCPVRALRAWLSAAGIHGGPVFRGITRHGTIRAGALSGESIRLIVVKRAGLAGLEATRLEPISPHGLRAGFVTTAYRNGVPDEEIMGHTRHRSLTVMRSYVRRSKLSKSSPAGKLGL